MAKKLNITYIDIDDAGGNYPLSNDYTVPVDKYIVRIASGDTGTLSGNVTITATNVEAGVIYPIEFEDVFVRGAFSFTVFGTALTAVQVANKPQLIAVDNGSSFDTYVSANSKLISVEAANIADEAITLAKMQDLPEGAILVGDATNRPSQADFSASGRIPIGNGTTVASTSVGGDATLASDGTLTIANDAVNNNKLANIPRGSIKVGGAADAPTDLDCSGIGRFPLGDGTDVNATTMSGDTTIDATGAVTISNGAVTVPKATGGLVKDTKVIEISFESGEQADNSVYFNYDGTVDLIYWEVIKAIAGTDDATITPENNAGTSMTGGLISLTASTTLNTAGTVTPTANNTFVAGDVLKFPALKTTAGGKVRITLAITKS